MHAGHVTAIGCRRTGWGVGCIAQPLGRGSTRDGCGTRLLAWPASPALKNAQCVDSNLAQNAGANKWQLTCSVACKLGTVWRGSRTKVAAGERGTEEYTKELRRGGVTPQAGKQGLLPRVGSMGAACRPQAHGTCSRPHSRRLLRCGASTACCVAPFRPAAQPCAAPADPGGTT